MELTRKKHLKNGSGFCIDSPGSLLGNLLSAFRGMDLIARTSPKGDRITVASNHEIVIDEAYDIAKDFETFSKE